MNDLVTKEAWKVVKKDLMNSVNHTCTDFVEALGENPKEIREKHLAMIDKITDVATFTETSSELVVECLKMSESLPEFIILYRNIIRTKEHTHRVNRTQLSMDEFIAALMRMGGKRDE